MSLAAIDAVRQVVQNALNAAGLAGVVGASALLSTLTLLWWGYRLSSLVSLARTAAAVALRYGGVSALVLAVVIAGAVHLGIIPGIDIERLMELVAVVTETLTPSGGGGGLV